MRFPGTYGIGSLSVLTIRNLSVASAVMIVFFARHSGVAQHTVVLRDLTVIRGEVASLDKQAVRFSDGRVFEWDQVLQSNLPDSQQQQFNSFVENVGLPLFRVRQRLASEDWDALTEVAEPLYQQLQIETDALSDRAQYIINLATMRGRLNTLRRSAAVLPFLKACEIRKQANIKLPELAGLDLTEAEVSTALTTEILPVWFDERALPEAINQLQLSLKPDLQDNVPGHILYLASMLLSRNDVEGARKYVEEINRRNLQGGWQQLLAAQFAMASGNRVAGISSLQKAMDNFATDLRLTASYVVGVEQGNDKNDSDLAVLNLLRIPAVQATRMKTLSAAAIYAAIGILQKNGQTGEALTLRNELLERYPNTYHGKLIIAE